MTLTKLIGRESYFRGKTLYEIVCNLKNFGEGRVVTRLKFLEKYPEKSYYRLTKVEPDMTDLKLRRGKALGVKVFRGENLGEKQIAAGMKMDWKLIPKEDEIEFCKLTEKDQRTDPEKITPKINFPPLLEALVKQEMLKSGQEVTTEPLTLKLIIKKSNRAKLDV